MGLGYMFELLYSEDMWDMGILFRLNGLSLNIKTELSECGDFDLLPVYGHFCGLSWMCCASTH